MIKRKLPAVLSVGLCSFGLYAAGCGQIKKQSDHSVSVESAPGASTTKAKKQSELVKSLVDILNLYGDQSGDGSLTKEGLTHMVEKFKPQIENFLSGSGLKVEQLVDLVFSFDKNKDGRVNPDEIVGGIKDRVKTLAWTNATESLNSDQIIGKIAADFPTASPAAKEGLAKTLMLFDKEWAQGSNDGLLDSRELAVPGLVMSVIENTDLSNGFKIGDNAFGIPVTPFDKKKPQLMEEQVNLKLRQQLLGRYDSIDFKKLSTVDNKLEWMQLALKFILSDRAVKNITWDTSDEGSIDLKQVKSLLIAMGHASVIDSPSFALLGKYYDSPVVGGSKDLKYDTTEIFQLVTDVELAEKLKDSKLYQNKEIINALYPNSVGMFDDTELSLLNELSSRDLAGFVLETSYSKLVDAVFEFYDADRNGKLRKREMKSMLIEIDPRFAQDEYIQAFFANAIPGDPNQDPSKLKSLGEMFRFLDQLFPSEVLVRVRNLMKSERVLQADKSADKGADKASIN